MKHWLMGISVLICLASAPATAQDFGAFSAITMDRNVVQDVFTRGNDIYVKVDSAHWDATLNVRVSDENMAAYRTWSNGENEMTIKVYQSQKENLQGYTYRIHTTARYVEYWMDGKLILHLERTS